MRRQDGAFLEACREISRGLLAAGEPGPGAARAEIMRVCSEYSLERVPRNEEILAAAGGGPPRLRRLLMKKPVRTASGVAVIALMPMPYACPHGRCTYCPGGKEAGTPNSYTGSEPLAAVAAGSGFDPGAQIRARLGRLAAYGHDASKAELVIVGGTFLFMPAAYRERFVRSCYDALNGFASPTLEAAKSANESARHRCVGFTVETKPDYCREGHVDEMLGYGMTRVEIGVQSLREVAYRASNRGHTYADVAAAFRASRDAGYKVAAHMMPGLPTATPDGDIADFGRLFSDPDLRPDMLKIYPTLVMAGTPLHAEYAAGRYEPYTDGEMVRVVAEAKRRVPRWARIMRVQREIPPGEIAAGPRAGNLRQLAAARLRAEGAGCVCIRCREAGRPGRPAARGRLRLDREEYEASGGLEVFLSYVDGADSVYGFARLRSPGPGAHRPEVTPRSCIVRELHVYGRSLGIGERPGGAIQHSGLGRGLMAEAERSAREDLGASKLLVISAVGTRRYYAGLGYRPDGPYVSKVLA